jgi:hypothetical protein
MDNARANTPVAQGASTSVIANDGLTSPTCQAVEKTYANLQHEASRYGSYLCISLILSLLLYAHYSDDLKKKGKPPPHDEIWVALTAPRHIKFARERMSASWAAGESEPTGTIACRRGGTGRIKFLSKRKHHPVGG